MGTVWYLWAVNDDPNTNEYLVKVIGEQNPECVCADRLCADGEKRNLYRCPAGYANVRSALAAVRALKWMKIEVFKEEIERVIVRYDLWKQKSRRRAHRSVTYRKIQSHLGPRRSRA